MVGTACTAQATREHVLFHFSPAFSLPQLFQQLHHEGKFMTQVKILVHNPSLKHP